MVKTILRGSLTEMNLAKAFLRESQARNRYTFYAEKAKEAGYPVLEDLFLSTADNERGHAEIFYEYLSEADNNSLINTQQLVMIANGDISENLYSAAKGEYEEWKDIYPLFGSEAEKEGFEKIARSFHSAIEIEKRHDYRFREYFKMFNANRMFISDIESVWECTNCGYRHKGKEAPEICPMCLHSQRFYKNISEKILLI